jgi:hypothetical protein
MLMLYGTIAECPPAENVEAPAISAIAGQPVHPTDVSLKSLPECPVVIDARCIPPLAPNVCHVVCLAYVFYVVCRPIVEEKRWQLVVLIHIARIDGVVPRLPKMEESVKLPVFVCK